MKVNKIHYVDNYSEYLEGLGVGWMRNGQEENQVLVKQQALFADSNNNDTNNVSVHK